MYSNCIRSCPLTSIILTLSASFGLLAYFIYNDDLPRLEDPTVGFEARNTLLAKRINTWRLLIESTSWDGGLSLYPHPKNNNDNNKSEESSPVDKNLTAAKHRKNSANKQRKKNRNKNKSRNSKPKSNEDRNPFESKNHQLQSDAYFCGKIVEDYVHFIVEANDGSNLLELDSIKNLCKLDSLILRMERLECMLANTTIIPNDTFLFAVDQQPSPKSIFCEYCEVKNHNDCCPSWTLANYILLHSNKSDCELLEDDDIDRFVSLLNECLPFYVDHYLNEDCSVEEPNKCPNTPSKCFQSENLAFNVFHYMVDYRFMNLYEKILFKNETETYQTVSAAKPFLSATSIFLPMAKSSKLMAYFESITDHQRKSFFKNDLLSMNMIDKHKNHIAHGNVHVVAADLGLKYTLFNKSVITDLILPSTAGLLILFSLLVFTRSILLTTMTLFTNVASLSTAYFIYKSVLHIGFFPFLNLLSLIILVAIGSDNALIYCKAWSCVSSSPPVRQSSISNRREREMSTILNHVLMSSFCASFTTCGAFIAGYFSDITSLKCFSVFSALSIITNFFITAIVFPAAIILSDRIGDNRIVSKYCRLSITIPKDCFQYFFDKIILKIVFNYHYILMTILTLISFMFAMAVLYWPGLQLPNSQDFQIFNVDHLFERYDLKYRDTFWFSRMDRIKDGPVLLDNHNDNGQNPSQELATMPTITVGQSNPMLPIRVVFGILPEDNGDSLNPFDRGKLTYDPLFNISSQKSQVWLLEFCREIRAQVFYKSTLGPMLTNCFIETLYLWMEKRKCTEIVGDQVLEHYPCCELSKFPYTPNTFNHCLTELINRLHRTPNFVFMANQAGPRFNTTDQQLKAFVIEYDSIYDGLANSFDNVNQIWHTLDQWISQRLKMAPDELKNGWFITSNLEFYALQLSLSTGVVKSLFISVLFAFVTLVFTTVNIRLSIISIISISFIIFTSIGTLIFLGWKLNIIESIVITLTIGLSIDATLHYTIAYKMLTQSTGNRLLGIQMTVARIGSPVVMGTVTTFIAGTIMLLSNVLAYIQIGTFLMVISFYSLIYSTLFHLSLLIIFGTNQTSRKNFWFDHFCSGQNRKQRQQPQRPEPTPSIAFINVPKVAGQKPTNNNNHINSANIDEIYAKTLRSNAKFGATCFHVTSI